MRAPAAVLAAVSVALAVASATAAPRAGHPKLNGTWRGDFFSSRDEYTLSSSDSAVSAGQKASWVCDADGWRPLQANESVPATQGPVTGFFNGSWTGDRTFTASTRYCYTGPFNANLNSARPPFVEPADLTGTVSDDSRTITYSIKALVPCNTTDFSWCTASRTGILTRAPLGADLVLTLRAPKTVEPDGHLLVYADIENKGDVAAFDVQLKVTVKSGPNAVVHGRAFLGCTRPAKGTFTCRTLALDPGKRDTVMIYDDGDTGDSVQVTASVTTSTGETTSTNNRAAVAVPIVHRLAGESDFLVTLSGPHARSRLDEAEYFTRVVNGGPDEGPFVLSLDFDIAGKPDATVRAQVAKVFAHAMRCAAGGAGATCKGTLEAKAKAVLTLRVVFRSVHPGETVVTSVKVKSVRKDLSPRNNTDEVRTEIDP
jgi:hypothetical protein